MKESIDNPRIHPDYLIGNNTEGLVFKDGPLAEFEPYEYALQGYDASTGEDPVEYTVRKSEFEKLSPIYYSHLIWTVHLNLK
jgi:hypothetical protein